ncbi:hypothetical protein [Streptomyces nigra]|uniref:hypothetical protein n=1 Tax=Streptomyces nigra TaxID=1827580 RepID=UPI00363EC69F
MHRDRVEPDGSDELHESRTRMYRLATAYHRPLGSVVNDGNRPADNEFLAVPAKERYDRDAGYRLPELGRYLTDQERVRLEPVLLPNHADGLPQRCPRRAHAEGRPHPLSPRWKALNAARRGRRWAGGVAEQVRAS